MSTTTKGARVGRPLWRRVVSWSVTGATVILAAYALLVAFGPLSQNAIVSSSMQPALKVGDLNVSRDVPATEIEPGDVATLPHPEEQMLITHRVLSVQPDPENPAGRLIEMQGDDNRAADPVLYPAETVGKQVLRVPMAGAAMQAISQPPVSYVAIGALLLLVAAPFLPRRAGSKTATSSGSSQGE